MKLTIVDVFAEARYQGNQLAVVENAAGLAPEMDRCACSAAPSRAGFGPPFARLFSARCAVLSRLWSHFSVNEGQWSAAWVILLFPGQSKLRLCRTST